MKFKTEWSTKLCGICGGVGPAAPDARMLRAQLESIKHRGPDDTGIFVEQGVSLGMCRLAIVEIENGKQPVENELVKLVFNGEIYNYLELKKELEGGGIVLRNASESEILIALYMKFGIDFIAKINGMFAIALYNVQEECLYLIRDRLGKKPLWYTERIDGTLLFSSEVKGLLAVHSNFTLRTEMIAEVLQRGYIDSPKSSFHEVLGLEPGSYLCWKSGKSKITKYWSLNFEFTRKISYSDALDETRSLIRESVMRRMHSERPIGVFLSGGVDSSVIAAFMASLSRDVVQSFSIGFDSKGYDEAPFARKVAEHLGTRHYEEIIQPDPSLLIGEIGDLLDQPFADSSIIPTYLLSKFARQNTIVALGGDGGDEVFGGYDRYLAAPILQSFNKVFYLSRFLQKSSSFTHSRKVRRLIENFEPKLTLGDRYSSIMSLIPESQVDNILHPNIRGSRMFDSSQNQFPMENLSKLNQMLKYDFQSYLPNDLLVKADLGSMGNSLELRSPFLDFKLVEWGVSLPSKFKVANFETKHILKEIAREFIPRELINRPKMGFAIPRAEWLRNELKPMVFDLLTDHTARSRQWFDQAEVRRVLSLHNSGKDMDKFIWPMIMLEIWARKWLD